MGRDVEFDGEWTGHSRTAVDASGRESVLLPLTTGGTRPMGEVDRRPAEASKACRARHNQDLTSVYSRCLPFIMDKFVFGDVFFVSRRFVGHPHCLFGLQQVFGEPFQHLLPQHEFIHYER